MLRTGHVPDSMKRGVIITMHKGGNKRRDLPDNFRAITLTSVLLKLYESVLLTRSKVNIMSNINKQQGGFQDGLPCLMTSFILRESVYFARESNSKLYACFMDGRKAFDTVWHRGMLYKLYTDTDIDSTSFLAFCAIYTNMSIRGITQSGSTSFKARGKVDAAPRCSTYSTSTGLSVP
jgi:hypothetical protein